MRRILNRLLVVALLTTLAAIGTFGDSIGLDCGSGNCGGNVYTLNLSSFNSTTNSAVITFTDDTSRFTGSKTHRGYLLALALSHGLGGGGAVPFSDVTLTSAPGGIAEWSAEERDGESQEGCDSSGNAFFCTELDAGFGAASASDPTGSGNIYTWSSDVSVPSGQTLTTSDELKTVFYSANTANTYNGILTSAGMVFYTANTANTYDGVETSAGIKSHPDHDADPVPEPVSALLYGTGLFVILLLRRSGARN